MNKTAIMIILDESPSMSNVRDETIKGLNIFLAKQKEDPTPASLSLVKFNSKSETVYLDTLLAEVPDLTRNTYAPGGAGTALYDAICTSVNSLGERLRGTPEGERPEKVICVIITDGEENSSREFSLRDARRMIEEQTNKYSWSFVFLGADIDASKSGGALGIDTQNIAQYRKSSTDKAYEGVSRGISRSRGMSPADVKTFGTLSSDDKELIEDGEDE